MKWGRNNQQEEQQEKKMTYKTAADLAVKNRFINKCTQIR